MAESVEKDDPLLLWTEKEGKAKEFYKIIEKAEQETLHVIKNSKERIWENAGLVYLHAGETKYRIKRMLVDYLRIKYPGKVVTVSINKGKKTSFSTRSPGPDLTQVIPKAVEGIPEAFHGGHPGAYGTDVPKEYRERFVENLARVLSKPF